MRFRRIDIDAFGSLEGCTSGPSPLGDLVVVEGPNEAGKSTLFAFLTSILYGSYPTTLDNHPYTPWSGAEMGGSARILVGGDEIEVIRRLRSSPLGTVVRGGRSQAIRNETVDFATHLSREVFTDVFALSLPRLAHLEREGWRALEDQILGRLGATDLRPAREVAGELWDEVRRLRRPDRRGRQRLREVGEELRAAMARRAEVRERSRHERATATRLAGVEAEIATARAERDRAAARLDHLRRVLPLRREREEIRKLRDRAGPPDRLAGLPADPVAELAHRRQRVQEGEAEVAALRDRIRARAADLDAATPADHRLVALEHEIDAFRGRVAGSGPRRLRLASIEQEIVGLERRLADEADHLAWTGPRALDALVAVDSTSLDEAWERWREASRRAAMVPGPAPGGDERDGAGGAGAAGWGWIGLAGATGVAGAIAWVLAPQPLPPRGIVLFVVAALALGAMGAWGVWTLAAERRARQSEAERREAERRTAATLREAERSALAEVTSLLAPAGLDPASSPADLPSRIRRCRDVMRDWESLEREAGPLRTELREVEAEGRALAERVGVEGDADTLAVVLHERLKAAGRRVLASKEARASTVELREACSRREEQLERERSGLTRLISQLQHFDADPDAGAAEAARALRAAEEARSREARLGTLLAEAGAPDAAGSSAHPGPAGDSDDDGDRGANVGTGSEEALAAEIARLDDRIEDLRADETRLREALAAHQGQMTLDDAEGEVQRLVEQRNTLRRQHDRLLVLATLVEEADRAVRDRHQPEVLRLAGEHLATLTAGRYDHVEVSTEGERTFLVRGPAASDPIPVAPPLSTGIREQVHFALRLALARHLDEGGARLPLLLDEVLVNWDPARRAGALDLLDTVARERQIFVFTCHPPIADLLAARGATRWTLERQGGEKR